MLDDHSRPEQIVADRIGFWVVLVLFVVSLIAVALALVFRPEIAAADQVRPNFTQGELCKGHPGCVLDDEFLDRLQALRERVGRPVVVTSGYRDPAYNAQVGGVPDSLHVHGKAADIKVAGLTPEQVADAARAVGFRGVGVYDRHCHVDVGQRREWRGTSK